MTLRGALWVPILYGQSSIRLRLSRLVKFGERLANQYVLDRDRRLIGEDAVFKINSASDICQFVAAGFSTRSSKPKSTMRADVTVLQLERPFLGTRLHATLPHA